MTKKEEFTILVKNQKVKIKWTGCVKKYYEEKGYNFTKLFDEFNVDITDLPNGSQVKVKCICDYCGNETMIPYSKYLRQTNYHRDKYACKKCTHKKIIDNNAGIHPSSGPNEKIRLSKEKVIEIVESKNNNKLLNPEEYKDTKCKNLKIKCGSCGNVFLSSLSNIINSGGKCHDCGKKFCGQYRKYSKEYVKKYIESINGNILINPNDYKGSDVKNLKIKCGKCGNIYTISFSKYKNSKQTTCPECGIARIGEKLALHPDKVKEMVESQNNNILLNPQDYQNNHTANLKIKCGECGDVYTTNLARYQSGQIRCSKCSQKESVGERVIEDILISKDINYIQEKRFDDCKDKRSLPFDFYLPDNNLCIEFDGPQHFKPIFGKESFEKTKKHDEIKNNYCVENSIDLLRIPYWEGNNIEQILFNKINI